MISKLLRTFLRTPDELCIDYHNRYSTTNKRGNDQSVPNVEVYCYSKRPDKIPIECTSAFSVAGLSTCLPKTLATPRTLAGFGFACSQHDAGKVFQVTFALRAPPRRGEYVLVDGQVTVASAADLCQCTNLGDGYGIVLGTDFIANGTLTVDGRKKRAYLALYRRHNSAA